MPQKFEERTGIVWQDDRGLYRFGLVVAAHDDGSIEFVPVLPVNAGTKCYDDPGAKYGLHRDNVRLKYCPPPFDYVCACESTKNECYAYADVDNAETLSALELSALGAVTIDNGAKVADDDFRKVLDHPWPRQLEKRLSPMDRLRMAQEIAPKSDGKQGFDYSL